jgi:hypothetical protein
VQTSFYSKNHNNNLNLTLFYNRIKYHLSYDYYDTIISLSYYKKYFEFSLGNIIAIKEKNINKNDLFLSINLFKSYNKISYSFKYKRSINEDVDTKNTNLYSFGISSIYFNQFSSGIYYEYESQKYIQEQSTRLITPVINYFILDNLSFSLQYNYYLTTNIQNNTIFSISYYF